MKLSISTLVRDRSIYTDTEETLSYIKSLGTQQVEIAAYDGWQDHISPAGLSDKVYADNLYNTITKSGLVVDSINAGFFHHITTADKVEFSEITRDFGNLCRFANKLDVRSITIGPGFMDDRGNVAHNMQMLKANIPYMADIASENNVLLSLECHESSTLEGMDEIATAMNWFFPRVGLTMDPSHPEMQCIPLDELRDFVKYTYMVHVRTASKGNMQETLEKNTVDFPKFFDLLKSGGYDEAVSIEFFNNFSGGEILEPFIGVMQGLGLDF